MRRAFVRRRRRCAGPAHRHVIMQPETELMGATGDGAYRIAATNLIHHYGAPSGVHPSLDEVAGHASREHVVGQIRGEEEARLTDYGWELGRRSQPPYQLRRREVCRYEQRLHTLRFCGRVCLQGCRYEQRLHTLRFCGRVYLQGCRYEQMRFYRREYRLRCRQEPTLAVPRHQAYHNDATHTEEAHGGGCLRLAHGP